MGILTTRGFKEEVRKYLQWWSALLHLASDDFLCPQDLFLCNFHDFSRKPGMASSQYLGQWKDKFSALKQLSIKYYCYLIIYIAFVKHLVCSIIQKSDQKHSKWFR